MPAVFPGNDCDSSGRNHPIKCFSFGRHNQKKSPYEGIYEGDRKIWMNEENQLLYQRSPSPIPVELQPIEGDLYKFIIPEGAYSPTERPNLFFVKNEEGEVTAIELVFKDKRDGPFNRLE